MDNRPAPYVDSNWGTGSLGGIFSRTAHIGRCKSASVTEAKTIGHFAVVQGAATRTFRLLPRSLPSLTIVASGGHESAPAVSARRHNVEQNSYPSYGRLQFDQRDSCDVRLHQRSKHEGQYSRPACAARSKARYGGSSVDSLDLRTTG